MQFGVFTIGDLTTDPTTGTTPSEHDRIKATVRIAKKAEEVGLDVFATGQHHNPPFIAPANPQFYGQVWRRRPKKFSCQPLLHL